jgi:hypothetical protein
LYGNVWEIIDPGGDCGENNLVIDTDGDGIKDRCNSPIPDLHNCERTTYKCSFDPDAVCVLDEAIEDYNDFTKWTVYNWNGEDTYVSRGRTLPSSNWEVLNKSSVIQHVNGMPTYFLSNYEMQDGLITMEGTFKTDDPGDNDWFGFVFGMKDETHYYLLDWSRWKNDNYNKVVDGKYINRDDDGNPINGAIPLTLAKVSALTSRGPLWSHTDSGTAYQVLQRKDNGGWTSGQEYKIRIEISRNDIKAWIGKVGEPMHLDINYHSDIAFDISGKLGFYNYSISRVTYKDFRIEWNDGKDITKITKRPLINPANWTGNYKEEEYGVLREGTCPNSHEQCMNALSSIEGIKNKLCLTNKSGQKGCFKAEGTCLFNGIINDTGITKKPIFSFLNSPDEVVEGYHNKIKIDYDSPTNISLNFDDLGDSSYDIEQIKSSASLGDKITIDFWMYWRGDKNGMPIGFDRYDLWISNYEDKLAFGFNTAQGDLYGIDSIEFLKNSWHRITAVFTQGDILQNELYIDGVKQVLAEQHLTRLYHKNSNADITKPLRLSGWRANDNYALDAKIAGINIYDFALSENDVKNLVSRGDFAGISRLQINTHSIVGYDAYDKLLGEINSTCFLSGKVGFKAENEQTLCSIVELRPRNYISTKDVAVLYSTNNGDVLGLGKDIIWIGKPPVPDRSSLPKHWTYCGHPTKNPIEQILYNDEKLYLSSDGTNFSFCDGSGADGNWFIYKNRTLSSCAEDEEEIVYDGKEYCMKETFSSGICSNTLQTAPSDMINIETKSDSTIVARIIGFAKVANPITATKIINNRIEFWNSYKKQGNSGFIEVIKEVAPQDKENGYVLEFKELDKLYQLGFTAFISINDTTYATSSNPMDITMCQNLLEGTHYFLAERNASDEFGLSMINELSHYLDGSFGDYCIIEKKGNFDNLHVEYSIKEENIKNTHVNYFCSPWSCKGHICGYAQCQKGSFGNMIMEADKPLLNANTCIDDKCDINNEYFRYCGNPHGCATNDITITQTDDGQCKKAECQGDDLFNPETGACEKIDCKYLKMDGKCYKKVY